MYRDMEVPRRTVIFVVMPLGYICGEAVLGGSQVVELEPIYRMAQSAVNKYIYTSLFCVGVPAVPQPRGTELVDLLILLGAARRVLQFDSNHSI